MKNNYNSCSIITVNYNSFLYTKNLIKNLEYISTKNFNLFIIDNFSDDNSYQKIFNLLKFSSKNIFFLEDSKILESFKKNNIFLIRLKSNYGYSAAVNIPLNINDKIYLSKFFWIINNDVEIEVKTLDILKKEYIPNSITTPMVYDLNNKNNIQSLGCTVNSLLLTTKNLKNLNNFNKIDYISGVSLFFDKNVLRINGNLPEKYFMYYEDVDWCKKATSNDIKLLINTNTKIFHKKNKNIDFKLKFTSILNRLRFCLKFYPYKIPSVFIYSMFGLIYHFIKYLLNLKNVK